jgi:Ca2+/Na+ antiporter
MNIWILITLIVGVIAIITGFIVYTLMRKKKEEGISKEPDYQAFVSVGFIWISVGVVFMSAVNPALGIAFMALGIVYLVFGLANKDKWKKKE